MNATLPKIAHAMGLIALLLFAHGCTQPAQKMGFAGEDYADGKWIKETVRLIDKDKCIFGEMPFFLRGRSPMVCEKMEAGRYYEMEGRVIRHETWDIGYMNLILQTLGTGEDSIKSDRRLLFVVPTLDVYSSREVEYPNVFLNSFIWENGVGKAAGLSCVSVSETLVQTKNGLAMQQPSRMERNVSVRIEKVMLGKTSFSNGTVYPLLAKVSHPAGLQALDVNDVVISNAASAMGYGETFGNYTYFEFDLPAPITIRDITRMRISLGDSKQKEYGTCIGEIGPVLAQAQ